MKEMNEKSFIKRIVKIKSIYCCEYLLIRDFVN